MAMIKCYECGKEISDKATSCPNCGCPVQPIENQAYDNSSINKDVIFTIDGKQENMDELWKKYKNKNNCIAILQKKHKINKKLATQIVEDYMSKSGAKEQKLSGCGTLGLIFIILCVMLAFCGNNDSNDNDNNVSTSTTEESISDNNVQADVQFELGTVYNENGFNINLIEANRNEMKFEIENTTDKEYDVYIYPRAINNTMETFNHSVVEKVSAGKKTQAVVDIRPEKNNYDVIKSVSYTFAFYELTGSAVSFMEFQSDPIVIKSNMYDDKVEYATYDTLYSDEQFKVGCVNITDDYVEISVINESDTYYELNVNNASINEWTYDVNSDLFVTIFNEPIFPHTQNVIKIDYNEFVKDKGISVNSFEFVLGASCPNDYEKSYQTDKILFEK